LRRNAAAGAMLPGMLLLSTQAKTRIQTTASKRRIVGETI
jgi:hypothetical protein